jgi:acyl-CoA reductase-like NAD-dependent aldehyde dehydrogenase
MSDSLLEYAPYTVLDFEEANRRAQQFADHIEKHSDDLVHILLKYESHEVAQDEISRTLDLLRSLEENKEYFKVRIGEAAAFLPRNQPLYAFSCFVVVPSLMASRVHFRIPHSMKLFFADMLDLLEATQQFPNIVVSPKQRIEFLTERSALLVDPKTQEVRPVTEAVIFTGLPLHAEQLRTVFDKRTMFISNGAGHNPIVISNDADLEAAVEAVTTLQFYNQGQDCAAPNSVLIQSGIYRAFMVKLHETIKNIKIGEYLDRSCRIGPISDPKDLVRIQDFLCENSTWLDMSTPGIIETRNAIVMPTVITKPLEKGGNFNEIFAPIIFAQKYENDAELSKYFEDKQYVLNAMYVTLYGSSEYIHGLIGRSIEGRILHTKETFLHNKHLHAEGMERGTCQYGGYGYGASSVSFDGKTVAMPTLPQREIYEFIEKPLLKKLANGKGADQFARFTEIQLKNVQKILRLHSEKSNEENSSASVMGSSYLDTQTLPTGGARYLEIAEGSLYRLLPSPNVDFAANLDLNDRAIIQSLKDLLQKKPELTQEDFASLLYALPKKEGASAEVNQDHQRRFFKNVYQLLGGKESGPKLTFFLWEAETSTIYRLLDI